MRTMKLLVMALGVLITAIGLVGVAAPSALLEIGRSLQTTGALYAVAVVRVAIGALLLSVASASRMPRTLRAVGTIIIVAGLVTPVIEVERAQAMRNSPTTTVLDGQRSEVLSRWLTSSTSKAAGSNAPPIHSFNSSCSGLLGSASAARNSS